MSKTDDDSGLVRGSGNVFRDFGRPDADVLQTKALLAAQIVGILDEEELSTRGGQARTGVGYADFARIRTGKLERFTIDRLKNVLNKLRRRVDVRIDVQTSKLTDESRVV